MGHRLEFEHQGGIVNRKVYSIMYQQDNYTYSSSRHARIIGYIADIPFVMPLQP